MASFLYLFHEHFRAHYYFNFSNGLHHTLLQPCRHFSPLMFHYSVEHWNICTPSYFVFGAIPMLSWKCFVLLGFAWLCSFGATNIKIRTATNTRTKTHIEKYTRTDLSAQSVIWNIGNDLWCYVCAPFMYEDVRAWAWKWDRTSTRVKARAAWVKKFIYVANKKKKKQQKFFFAKPYVSLLPSPASFLFQ